MWRRRRRTPDPITVWGNLWRDEGRMDYGRLFVFRAVSNNQTVILPKELIDLIRSEDRSSSGNV